MKRLAINEETLLGLLAAHPEGLSAGGLRAGLRRVSGMEVSQPTLSRRLAQLRARGQVVKTGDGPATKYAYAPGSHELAEMKSRALHEKVAEKLVKNPALLEKAQSRLAALRQSNPAGRKYHDRWEQLLKGDRIELLRTLASNSDEAKYLRQESPFAGILVKKERHDILRRFNRQ